MVFDDDPDKKLAFILFTLIIFFGVSGYMLMFNYFDVPKLSEDHSYIFGVNTFNDPRIKQGFNWNISFNDKVISNIENIVIYVFMLWSILRFIDLLRFLVNYK